MAKGTQQEGLELLRDVARLNGHTLRKVIWGTTAEPGYKCESLRCDRWATFPGLDEILYLGSATHYQCGEDVPNLTQMLELLNHLRANFEGKWGA